MLEEKDKLFPSTLHEKKMLFLRETKILNEDKKGV